jgi:hypothetical protein|tara:strand:+ start:1524 stop:1904 length:381 start_codon:yes stop_codon:yes gene_type:complete
MGKLSRDKGKRGERMWRDLLRAFGFKKAYRTQQFSGKSPDGSSGDVQCPELPSIHWEVKNVETFRLWASMEQAMRDKAAGQIPVVAHTKNDYGFVVILPAEDFLNILRRSDLVEVEKLKDFSLLAE